MKKALLFQIDNNKTIKDSVTPGFFRENFSDSLPEYNFLNLILGSPLRVFFENL